MTMLEQVKSIVDRFKHQSKQIKETNMPTEEAEMHLGHAIGAIKFTQDNPSALSISLATNTCDLLQGIIDKHMQADANFQLATKDTLTALPNRGTLEATYNHTIGRINDGKIGSATLILVDANDFKIVNDYLGHPTGDRVLQAYANIMRSKLPESDYLARIGGDEFLIIIEHRMKKPEDEKDIDWVNPTSSEILTTIENHIINSELTADHPRKNNVIVPLNLTFGSTNIDPKLGLEQNIKKADLALYRNKGNKPDIYSDIINLGSLKDVEKEKQKTNQEIDYT